jgi:hypothetical protein
MPPAAHVQRDLAIARLCDALSELLGPLTELVELMAAKADKETEDG